MKKITLIGAGSVVFAKNLISDILQHKALQDIELCLMDIDSGRLKVAEVMARRIVEKLGVGATVHATTSREEAVRGASYVISTIQVGGYKPGTVIDFEIPARYGLRQTIGDTLGIGGIFRALRTIPELVKIADDIANVGAPDCLFLNYSNPMAMNCMGIDRATGVPHVGLCHSVQGTSRQLAGYAGIPYEDLTYLVAGINHMAFFLRFEYKGQDAYPLLFRALEQPQIFGQNKVRFEMMRRLGYFVTESSEHQAEYVPYFIHHGQDVIDAFDIPINEYLKRCEAIISTWEETERELLGGDGDIVVKPQTHEYGSYIINARETNEPAVIYGNVPNRNLITNLPSGCCVELPCLVDGNGIQPTHIGDLPPQLAAVCRSNIAVQELAVEAALTGKREHIYHAAMVDPHTAASLTLDKIWAMCDELIEAHQKAGLLGEFAPVYRHTGRSFAGLGDRVLAQLNLKGGYNEDEGARNTIELRVENPGAEAFPVKFRVLPSIAAVSVEGPTEHEVEVGAQGVVKHQLTLRNDSVVESNYQLDLSANRDDILCQGLRVTTRRRVRAEGGDPIPVSLELDGNPAVEATIELKGDDLLLKAKVADSNIKQAYIAMTEWFGSRIEVHVARDAEAAIRECYIVPGQDGEAASVVDYHFKPVEGARVEQRTTPMYYEIEAAIPKHALGLETGDREFLFDLACGLGRLGDAHSGGKTSLAASFGKYRDSSRFWLAEFA